VFASGNYIITADFHSWEIDLANKRYVYRKPEQTIELLQGEMGKTIGFYNYGIFYDSGMPLTFEIAGRYLSNIYYGRSTQWWLLPRHQYSWDKAAATQLHLTNPPEYVNTESSGINRFVGKYCGTDAKGLHYYWTVIPNLHAKTLPRDWYWEFTVRQNATLDNPDKQILLTIFDPWQEKYYFRVLPKGAWRPPYDASEFPAAIHPNGDFYFMDGNLATKTYSLKRLKNDWWTHIGFATQQVGLVTANRVRVRAEPSTTAPILSYAYEMEYARIDAISPKTETINGQTSNWYKVRLTYGRDATNPDIKLKDRIGWVFGAYLDIQ
jgi:hypothetical protein